MGKIQLRRMANASGHKHRYKYRIPPEQNTCHRKTKKHSHNCHVYLQHPSFIIGLCTSPSPAFEQKTSSPNLPLLPMLQQKPKRIYPNSTNDSRTPPKNPTHQNPRLVSCRTCLFFFRKWGSRFARQCSACSCSGEMPLSLSFSRKRESKKQPSKNKCIVSMSSSFSTPRPNHNSSRPTTPAVASASAGTDTVMRIVSVS